jgi:hypothetical protein
MIINIKNFLINKIPEKNHISRDRALLYIRKTLNFYSEKSLNIWKSYGEIADTIMSKDGNVIRIKATCSDLFIQRSIISVSKDIEIELTGIHKILFKRKSDFDFP